MAPEEQHNSHDVQQVREQRLNKLDAVWAISGRRGEHKGSCCGVSHGLDSRPESHDGDGIPERLHHGERNTRGIIYTRKFMPTTTKNTKCCVPGRSARLIILLSLKVADLDFTLFAELTM